MTLHWLWKEDSQSNGQGSAPNTTEGGADFAAGTLANNAAVLWAASDNFGEHASADTMRMIPWGDTIGGAGLRMPHHGIEQTIAALAVAAGFTTGGKTFRYAKATHNGTPISHFGPGGFAGNAAGTPGVDYFRHRRVLTLAVAPVPDFDWVYVARQGESDCDTTDGSLAQANALGANRMALYGIMAAMVGKPAKVALIQQIPSGVWGANQAVTGPWVPNGRASLLALHNTNAPDGCPFRVINVDDLPLYVQDSLHLTSAAHHTAAGRFWSAALPFMA